MLPLALLLSTVSMSDEPSSALPAALLLTEPWHLPIKVMTGSDVHPGFQQQGSLRNHQRSAGKHELSDAGFPYLRCYTEGFHFDRL